MKWNNDIRIRGLTSPASLVAIALAASALALSTLSPSNNVHLFCAAGLVRPAEAIRADLAGRGVRLQITYDGSGSLLGRLKAGATADLFLAAERSYLDDAARLGYVRRIDEVARQTPVIAVAAGNPKGVRSLGDLARGDIRVSLADPRTAAVGRAVRRLLLDDGRWDEFSRNPRLHSRDTVTQSAADLRFGLTDAAIVWDALARQQNLTIVRDPLLDHHREPIALGVIRPTPQSEVVRTAILGPDGRRHFAAWHFDAATE